LQCDSVQATRPGSSTSLIDSGLVAKGLQGDRRWEGTGGLEEQRLGIAFSCILVFVLGACCLRLSSFPISREPSPMEDGDRSSAKKARVLPPPGFRVKQEVPAEEEEEASGGRAVMAVDAAAAAAAMSVRIDRDMLHCPLCTLPLKPPIFQVGHLACGGCHGQLPTNQCHSCDGGGPYARCPAMDAFVAKVLPPTTRSHARTRPAPVRSPAAPSPARRRRSSTTSLRRRTPGP
ncbi:unnamed protein product, partial [Urochloa humidicola]